MTRDEAIAAINRAETVHVHVVTGKSALGDALYAETFPVSKAAAIAAMQQIADAACEPSIYVSADRREVTLGSAHTSPPAQTSSHFDNNNGNF